MRKLQATVAALALIGAAGVASAADQTRSGNARAGRAFIGYNCESCHVVAANQDLRPLIANYAPSFSAVANKPDTTPEALRTFLRRPHGYSNMPYPDLGPADLANVVAYIMSLRHSHDEQRIH
jgi:mono/diheme cytochrome c family protein